MPGLDPRKILSPRTAVAVAAAVLGGSLAVTAFAASRSGTTIVSGTVAQVVRLTVPNQLHITVCSRRTSDVADVPVVVVTNARLGYSLQVLRARFVPSDDSAEVMLDRPGVGQSADMPVNQWRPLNVGPIIAVGHRTGPTTATGDRWSTHLRFGAVSARQNGAWSGKVTYRVTAGATVTDKAIEVVLQIRANCGGN